MEKSFVHAALQNQKVLSTITLIVQAELEDLNAKLAEKETKLQSVEVENEQLVMKLGKLQLYLERADEVQKKFTEEINRLKDELQKSMENLQEKEISFKNLEKHSSQAIGDYTAECMVLKKSVAEKQVELDTSKEKIYSLEERVVKLEELLEKTDNDRLKQEIEEVNCRQQEIVGRSGEKETSSANSVSLHDLSSSYPLLPPPEQLEVSVRLTRLSLTPPSGNTKHNESCRKAAAVAVTENDKHGDAKKHVYKNGFKRRLCKCGLSFMKLHSLNRHISRKANFKNRSLNSASWRLRAHKTTSDCKTGSRTLVSSSPNTTHDTSTDDQEHCAINLNIAEKSGRVHCKCGKDFSNRSVFSAHILQQSSGRIFPCTLCDKRFYRHETLKKHMHGFHEKKNYNGFGCRKCGKVFDSSSEIVIHRINDH